MDGIKIPSIEFSILGVPQALAPHNACDEDPRVSPTSRGDDIELFPMRVPQALTPHNACDEDPRVSSTSRGDDIELFPMSAIPIAT